MTSDKMRWVTSRGWVDGVILYVSNNHLGGWKIHGRTWEDDGVWKCEVGLDTLPDELTEDRAKAAVEEAFAKQDATKKYGDVHVG